MPLEFKRGTVVSASYEYVKEEARFYTQNLSLVDTEGNEYNTFRFIDTSEFFGEGDRVSFLWDRDTELIIKIRLNPFYKEK